MKIKIYKDNYFTGEIVDVFGYAEFIQSFIMEKTPILTYSADTTVEEIQADTNYEIFTDDAEKELVNALTAFNRDNKKADFIIFYDEDCKLQIIANNGKWLYIAVADALGYGFETHNVI